MRCFSVLLIVAILCLSACKNHSETKQHFIYNKEFKWTIAIPAGFDTVNAAQWAKLQRRGQDAIETNHDMVLENNAKTIFVFKNDAFNYFESNYQPFEQEPEEDYFESFKEVNDLVYETFMVQAKGAQVDSAYSMQTISGLDFHSIKIALTLPNNVKMNWYSYSRPFGNKDFTVNIITVDQQKEKELIDAWFHSKFDN